MNKKKNFDFWKGDPKVIYEFEKGSTTIEAVFGESKYNEKAAALQFYFVRQNTGEKIYSKSIIFNSASEIIDFIVALEVLKEKFSDQKKGKKRNERQSIVNSSVGEEV